MTVKEDQETSAAQGSPQGKKPISGQFWTFPRKTASKTTTPNMDKSDAGCAVAASKSITSKKTMDPSHSARGQGDNVTGTYGATAKGSATDAGEVVTGKYHEEIEALVEKSFKLDPKKKGMFKGKSLTSIKKAAKHDTGKKKKEDVFAINAKEGKFKKHHKEETEQIDEVDVSVPNKDGASHPITPEAMKAITSRKEINGKARAGTDETGRERAPEGKQQFSNKNTMDVAHSKRPPDQGNTEETETEIETEEEGLITELEANAQAEYDKMINNQLNLVVRSAMNDQPDEFNTAFQNVLNAYLKHAVEEKRQQIQSTFLGVSTPAGGVQIPEVKEEEENGEEPATNSKEQAND